MLWDLNCYILREVIYIFFFEWIGSFICVGSILLQEHDFLTLAPGFLTSWEGDIFTWANSNHCDKSMNSSPFNSGTIVKFQSIHPIVQTWKRPIDIEGTRNRRNFMVLFNSKSPIITNIGCNLKPSQHELNSQKGVHFGLAEQRTARKDPHRLTYLSLNNRVRQSYRAGHGGQTTSNVFLRRSPFLWFTGSRRLSVILVCNFRLPVSFSILSVKGLSVTQRGRLFTNFTCFFFWFWESHAKKKRFLFNSRWVQYADRHDL